MVRHTRQARQSSSRMQQSRAISSRRQKLLGTPKKAATISPTQTQQIKAISKPVQRVDYEAAWKEARSHWLKGRAGQYLYFMRRGEGGPQQAAVYDYVKELVKQTKIGNISPGRSKGSLLAKEEFVKWKYTPKTPQPTTTPAQIPVRVTTPKGTEILVNRKNIIRNIRQGNIPGIKIKGGRIWDTITNKPISPMKIYNKIVMASVSLQTSAPTIASNVKITKSSDPKRLIVVLPNGVKGTINATGRVVIGKDLGGKKYVFQDGVLQSINNVKIEIAEADTRLFMSQSERDRKIRGVVRAEVNKVKADIYNSKKNLREGNLTPLEWYQNLATWIGSTFINTTIEAGIGGKALFDSFRRDPEATLLALPPAVVDVIIADFKRATSGDPIEVGTVLTEYATFASIGRLLGGVGKLTKVDKALVVLGRQFSPIYFNKLIKKGLVPPISLRRTIVKTPTGRMVSEAMKDAFKNTQTAKQFKAYSLKLRRGKANVNAKIKRLVLETQKVKRITGKVVGNLESRTNINKQFARVRRNFRKSMNKRTSIKIGNDDYVKAVVFIEGFSSNLARIKANKFLIDYKRKGGKLGLGQDKQFVGMVQKQAKNNLDSLSAFKELKNTAMLKKSFQINLRKRGKIETASIMFRKLKVKVTKLPLVKKMKSTINKISSKGRMVKRIVRRGVKRSVKRVGVGVRRVRKVGEKVVGNLESRTNINKQFNRARANFRKSMGRKSSITIGNNDFIKAIVFIEGFSKGVATMTARRFIINFKARGGKLGLGQEGKFITSAQNLAKKKLNSMSEFKKLKEASRLNKPFQMKLIRTKKLAPAKRLYRNLVGKVRSTSAVGKMSSIVNKMSRGVRKVRRGVSPQRIRAKLKRGRDVRTQRKFVKQTIRYQMEKSRTIRKVSLDKLKRSKKVSDMNKFIDTFFNELNKRQRINLAPLKFSQMKNVLKKRMRKAINKGNLPEINNFRIEVGKIVVDMNRKASNPNIKIRRTTGKDRTIRTIKDFESPSPKGTYKEVKVGNQVMLQEVKQVQRTKQVQIQRPVQRYKIVSVQKKNISLAPLMKFGVASLSGSVLANMQNSKQGFTTIPNQKSLMGVLNDSRQDFIVLQSVAQGMSPKMNVASAVAQAVNSKTRVRARLKTTQVLKTKKKPLVRFKLKKKKNTRKLSKPVMGYAFIVKKYGRNVRLKIPPLTLRDVWDAGSYNLDNTLQRTGRVVPLGMVSEVARLPKGIAGYYGRKSIKFRRSRIKKGKAYSLERTIIEKKKYVGDTAGEIRALRRKRATRKGIRRVASRKLVRKPSLKRRVNKPVKRKLSPIQRKKMLLNLKKARRVRARKRK